MKKNAKVLIGLIIFLFLILAAVHITNPQMSQGFLRLYTSSQPKTQLGTFNKVQLPLAPTNQIITDSYLAYLVHNSNFPFFQIVKNDSESSGSMEILDKNNNVIKTLSNILPGLGGGFGWIPETDNSGNPIVSGKYRFRATISNSNGTNTQTVFSPWFYVKIDSPDPITLAEDENANLSHPTIKDYFMTYHISTKPLSQRTAQSYPTISLDPGPTLAGGQIEVLNERGTVVKNACALYGNASELIETCMWTPKEPSGKFVAKGKYRFRIVSNSANGTPAPELLTDFFYVDDSPN